jgi:DNA recombination protein RmuC
MENQVPIIILILLCFGVVLFFLNKKLSDLKKNKSDETLLEWLKSMQQTMQMSSSDVTKVLQENSKQLNERLDRAASVIKDVGKEVGQMSEIGRSMRDLQEFLKSPKMRGNIGEEVLKDLISQIFPKNSFFLQYQFKSGERVDAAIKTDAGILPIDSKFPMENFQRMMKSQVSSKEYSALQKEFARDVKKHIDAISKKYIVPDEGTMDFALMYIPSESVYYEIVNLTEIMNYARRSRVYLVSPSTLYAHLQTILLSYEGKKIESRTREVFKMLRVLQNDYNKIEENIGVLGKHINNAFSQFGNVSAGFSQLGQKLNSTKYLEDQVNTDIKNPN